MKIETKLALIDLFINWFIFTPLVLVFWYGTYVLQDLLIFGYLSSRFLAIVILLVFGITVEFAVTFWQDEIVEYSKHLSNNHLTCFSRGYNYLLAVANICHYRGLHEIFDAWFGAGDFSASVKIAVTSIVLLWSLKASRNIIGIPFCISLDSDHSSWFITPTLYQYPRSRRYAFVGDVLLTVIGVSTLVALHWITLWYVFDNVILPNNPQRSYIASCGIGYAIMTSCSCFQLMIKKWSEFYDNAGRFISKTILEDIFIWVAAAGVIVTWKGIGMAVELTAREYPLVIFGNDISGLTANLISFFILSLFGVSASLVCKGAEMDGAIAKGDGVDFSRAYMRHFLSNCIQSQNTQQASDEKEKTD